MKRKVLVLLNNIPLYGSERGNINVFYALKESNIESLFVTHARYGDLYINPHLEELGLEHTSADYIGKICRRENIAEYFIEMKNSIRGNIKLFNIIRKYKPDYIHIGTEAGFISMIIALWLTKIPVIYRLGDKPRQNRKIFIYIWKKFIIPRVYKFICISNFIKDELLKLNVPESKIEVIYNSPPHRKIKERNVLIDNDYDKFIVSYLGQLTAEKGVDILVDAAIYLVEKYSNIIFYLAGDYQWQNPFAIDLIEKVKKSGVSERIIFTGMIEDTLGLLKSSQLHVCPSVWDEPLSNVTAEAKGSGIPSVIFPSGGLPEMIQHKVDGYICRKKNAPALIEAIEYYYKNPLKLKLAKEAAVKSMETLGITTEAYRLRWEKIYTAVE